MEFIKKITPYDIFNCTLFPYEKYISTNMIILTIYEFNKNLYYTFNINLPNIIISENDLVLIKKIFDMFSSIYGKLEISENSVYFLEKINSITDAEKNLDIILQEIFNILFKSKYITNETYFGISYRCRNASNTGYVMVNEFIKYSTNM